MYECLVNHPRDVVGMVAYSQYCRWLKNVIESLEDENLSEEELRITVERRLKNADLVVMFQAKAFHDITPIFEEALDKNVINYKDQYVRFIGKKFSQQREHIKTTVEENLYPLESSINENNDRTTQLSKDIDEAKVEIKKKSEIYFKSLKSYSGFGWNVLASITSSIIVAIIILLFALYLEIGN